MTDNKDIEKLIFDSLENLSITPSEMVKKSIDKKMFFLNMIHFHAVKLIIGTSLFTVVTGVVLYFALFNSPESNLQNNNILNIHQIESNSVTATNNEISIIKENISTENNQIISENNNTKIASNLAMTAHDSTFEIKSLKNKKVNSDNIVSKSENNSVKITENKSNVPHTKANIVKNEDSTEQNTNSKEIASYISTCFDSAQQPPLNDHLAMTENSEPNNVDLTNQDLITKNEDIVSNKELSDNSNIEYDEKVKKESDINKTLNINSNTEINNNIKNAETDLNSEIIYHKMLMLPIEQIDYEQETFKMNLLAIDSALLNEYLKAQNRWFLDFYWMPSLSTTFYKTDNAEFENLIEQKNNAVQNSLSYNSFGISGGFFKNNMTIKAGFGYTNLADNYNFSLILNNPTEKTNLVLNNNHYDFEQNGTYYNIDTVGGYYHYTYVQDSIIHLYDSAWVDLTETNVVSIYDSVKYIQHDSLKNKTYLNNFKYFEIPLSFGYKFQHNNFEITPEVGIITGFLYKKEGMNISNDLKNNETFTHTLPYKQFIISGTLAININYNISENFGIFIEPAYRQTIASFFNSSSIVKGNSKSFVVKFGIRKKF